MANNVGDDIGIADDSEIETPPAVDPRLPLVIGLAVGEFHRAGFVFRLRRPQPSILASIEAAISSAVLNGPKTRPCLMSSSDFASRASMMRRCAGVYSSSALANSERSITSSGVSTILPRSAMPIRGAETAGNVIWPLRWILTSGHKTKGPVSQEVGKSDV